MRRMSKNPYLQRFCEELRARFPVDGATMSYSEWLSANTTLNGQPFGYEGYEFQRQIVDDMHPDMAVIKPSQVGLTEVQVRKFLAWLKRNRGTSGIFTFPNERMFKNNSKTRIRPVLKQPVFNQGSDDDKPVRAMNLYEIDLSFAHIMGMTEGEATSTPADVIYHDELDLSNQQMVGLYQSRLQNSDHKITQRFSTPTHPGFGIDAVFNASDQHNYLCKCSACGHWNDPVFSTEFLNLPGYKGDGVLHEIDADVLAAIDLADAWFKCERCSSRLDLGNPELREWVAAFPARRSRGYRIRPSASVRLTVPYILGQLLKMKALENLRGWYNTVLGETYSDGNSRLEPEMVKACMKDSKSIEYSGPVALGCDMGATCHLVLGRPRAHGKVDPFHFEQVPSSRIETRIEELRQRFNIVCGGVDRHPYTPDAHRISEASNRKILPIEYRGTAHVGLKNDEYGALDFAQVNRTWAIDNIVRDIRDQAIEISGYGHLGQVLVEHCCDMVRVEADEKPASWEKLTGNDHFLHALALMKASVRVKDILLAGVEIEARSCIGLVGAGSGASLPFLGQPQRGRFAERKI